MLWDCWNQTPRHAGKSYTWLLIFRQGFQVFFIFFSQPTFRKMRHSAGHSCVTARERPARCTKYTVNPRSPDLWAQLKGRQLEACCVDHGIRRHPLILINEIPKGLRLTLISSSQRDFLSTGSWVSLWLDDEASLYTSIALLNIWSLILFCWYWCRVIWFNFQLHRHQGC